MTLKKQTSSHNLIEMPNKVFRFSHIQFSVTHILLAIIVVAVLLRLASAMLQGDVVRTLPGITDQISYDKLARRVIEGYGFSFGEAHWPATRANEPTAHWSYLYTGFLAVVYSIFGTHPLAVRVIQAVITGVLHSWLTYRVGQRVFGSTPA